MPITVKAACRFSKIFDVAYTFYEILVNASKILHALQNECSMEVFRKLFDALCEKTVHFLCNIQKKVSAITFNKKYFFESQETFRCLIRKIDNSLIL